MAIDPSFLDQLKKLTLLSRRRVSSIYAGSKKAIQQGRGIEVVDHTEYFPGDDPKVVDWKVYARTEKLYIKRFEEEKDMTLHMLLDSSASMDFSTDGMTKFDYAGSLAAGFAYIAVNENNKFSLALFAEKLREVMQPQRGKPHFFKAIDVMNEAELSGDTDIAECMAGYVGLIKSISLVVVLSDFLEPLEELEEAISRIARESKEAMLIQVLDSGELELPGSDDMIYEDMESGATERTYLSPSFRKEYHNSIREHVYGIREICDDLGVDHYTVPTNRPIFDSFMTLVNREMEDGRGI